MNKENILRVADAIEQHSIPDLGFNMVDYVAGPGQLAAWKAKDMSGHNCGTTACIAGWAVAVRDGNIPRSSMIIGDQAGEFLGLDPTERHQLFLTAAKTTKPARAVAVLRHLAETGVVDWSVA